MGQSDVGRREMKMCADAGNVHQRHQLDIVLDTGFL